MQADIFTGELRESLQSTFGYGGRGMVFPYSTGRTHSAVDYATSHTGRWVYAKNVEQTPELALGLSGISSRTTDSNASFHFNFKNTILPEFTKIRLYFKKSRNSYDLKIKTPVEILSVDLYDNKTDGAKTLNYKDIQLKTGQNEMSFYLQKTDSLQNEFEIYGLSIENPYDGGVLYHSVGINGAGYYSILRQQLMNEQLGYLKPDAVILDIGANDFWRNGINKDEFVANMKSTVELLRKHNPSITIIFSCSQDIYRGGYSIPDCGIFSQIISEFSRAHDCAFYDWYWISGGRYSMSRWRNLSLANKDFIHLTGAGYRLKGQMMAEGFYNTWNWLRDNKGADKRVFDIDSLVNPPIDSSRISPAPTFIWVYHKVARGQTIWSVCKNYDVTALQIRQWNNLKSNYLWTGQVLKIYSKAPVVENVEVKPVVNTPIKTNTQPKTAAKYHKVKSGETLYSISQKYNVTVSEIKRLNHITGSTIKIGQVLRIQ